MSRDPTRGLAPRADQKLDSWKEIAVYLQREVRTVQRWEKSEGLPVHRHHHEQRGTVFAHASELDAWLEERTRAAAPPESPSPSESGRARSPWRARALWLPAIALVAALVLWLGTRAGGDGGAEDSSYRLLVLPLASIAEDPLEETTGRALHEGLITGLAGLAPERLAVIGRTSALRYGASGLGLAEIGDALGVDHVLEGSVQRRGDELLVTTRLVRAAEESEVWSETFALETAGLAGQEQRLTHRVCAALADRLLGLEPQRATSAASDPRALEAWQRGRYLWHKGTRAGFLASVPQFEEALEFEPLFVDAHVGLASAYAQLGRYGCRPAHEVFPRAKAAAQRALELDPNAAGAHAALALVSFYYEWDFEAAARGFRTALRLGPELALTHHAYAHFLSCLGLHEEGLAAVRSARALEPLWPLVIADTAWFHFRARDFEEAARESRRALELEPGMQSAVLCLVECLRRQGDVRAAWAEMRSHLDAAGLLAQIPGLEVEDPELALRNVRLWSYAELERAEEGVFVSAHSHVFSLAALERTDEMLDWLEAGLESRDRVAVLMLVHPAFDGVREDPRFRTLVQQVGFPATPAQLIRAGSGG